MEGDGSGHQIADTAFHSGHRIYCDHGVADLTDLGFFFSLDPNKLDFGSGDVLLVPVFGVRCDPERVYSVDIEGSKGHARAGEQGVAVCEDIALIVGYTDIVRFDTALCIPTEHHITAGGVFLRDEVDPVFLVIIILQFDLGNADDSGLYILGGIFGEQQLLRTNSGDAGGFQSYFLLEQRHSFLCALSEIAADISVVVVQLFEPALQSRHAVVVIAPAQGDVAGRFRGVMREKGAKHRDAGFPGLPQACGALEHAHGGCGFRGVAAAGGIFQVVKIDQAIVQFPYAITCIAGVEVDITPAAHGTVGVESPECLTGSRIAFGHPVFGLKAPDRLQGSGTKDAVCRIGKVAQFAKPLLHFLYTQPSIAAGQLAIRVIGAELTGKNDLLQFGVGYAGHRPIQIKLQQLHRRLCAGPENAVDIVIIVTQVPKRLLYGTDRVAAAASGQRRILGRGFQKIPCGLFSLYGIRVQKVQTRPDFIRFRFKFYK